MKQKLFILAAALIFGGTTSLSQPKPAASPSPKASPTPRAPAQTPAGPPAAQQGPRQNQSGIFDFTEYGVRIEPEPRLLVMMAALDAAGFDPTPAGKSPSVFRAMVRKDQEGLDADLRQRLRAFYERNKLPAPATPADQAARYVSLAYILGPAPGFEPPPRSEDLPSGVLEVLDFAPLVRDFYRRSGMEERLPAYLRAHRDESDRLRRPASEMIRQVLSYLHTRPQTTLIERVPVKAPASSSKKEAQVMYTTRERERRFFIVPDLLGVPGAINFRIIADDYYTILPPGTDLASSEVRRAYLQYLVDPLIVRYNRDIAARREHLKQLLGEVSAKTGNTLSPDVFLTVSRSLVAAADVRLDEAARLEALSREMRSRLDRTTDAGARAAISKEAQERRARIEDETLDQLAEAYERGAVLAFYFADQLRGIETSGFDISNFFADMIATFDPARESRRPAEYAAARTRAAEARKARLAESAASATEEPGSVSPRNRELVRNLVEVDELVRLRNYEAAEARLRELMREFPREPRIFFALGRTASLSAREAIDEDVQAERLNRALASYRDAIMAASPDTDQALLSRSHEAMGRILAFLERSEEAAREFDAAIRLGNVAGGAYQEAVEGKKRLVQP
ncbi:MAG TPA: hypothetical protein VGB17_07435 [Pyrinomonadaceae bacterium]|jgi:hypothetical protein